MQRTDDTRGAVLSVARAFVSTGYCCAFSSLIARWVPERIGESLVVVPVALRVMFGRETTRREFAPVVAARFVCGADGVACLLVPRHL